MQDGWGKFFNQNLFTTDPWLLATLRVQLGPGWTATVLMAMSNTRELELFDQFTNRRKWKHVKIQEEKLACNIKNRGLKHVNYSY